MLGKQHKVLAGAAGMLAIGIVLTGCSDSTPVEEQEESQDSITVPLPSDAAKTDFDSIAMNSTERFYRAGAVETFALEDDQFSIIHLPNYELGGIAVRAFFSESEGAEGQELAAQWLYGLEEFSAWQADRVVNSAAFADAYEDIEQSIEYNVTLTPEGEYVVADDAGNSTKFFVDNNIITGRELRSVEDDSAIGRSYIQYNVGESETTIVDALVEQSTDEELEALFSRETLEE